MDLKEKKAVIYCRVSTKEQAEEGNSLATQERLCREYAQKHGYGISAVFIEMGESAKTADRTELKKLFAFCSTKKNEVKAVIAYKIDRISRNTDDYSQIRIFLKRYGVEIRSTSEYFEDTPAGRFMENIIANVAQFDNDVRTERSVGGMREAVREGRYIWLASYGYSNTRINGKATISPNQYAPFVKKAFEMVALRLYTLENIRTALIAEGMLMPNGKPIAKTSFYDMLRNPVYAGRINKFGESNRGSFDPIVTEELFNTVQLILSNKPMPKQSQKKNGDFPLRRLFRHPSGRLLTGCWAKGRSNRYPYYLYHKTGVNIRKEVLEHNFKGWLNQYFKLNINHFDKLVELTQNFVDNQLQKTVSSFENRGKKVILLKQKRVAVLEKNISGIISDEFCKEQIEALDYEIYTLQQQNDSVAQIGINKPELLKVLRKLILNPAKLWEDAEPEEKEKLQWFYFPDGIEFDGISSRTNKICILYKLKELLMTGFSGVVPHPNSESNTDIKQIPFTIEIELEKYECSEGNIVKQVSMMVEQFAIEAIELVKTIK